MKFSLLLLLLLVPLAYAIDVVEYTPSDTITTSNVNITLLTNMQGRCKIDKVIADYENMKYLMETEDEYRHTYSDYFLPNGDALYYVRCIDNSLDPMNESYELTFTVEKEFINSTQFENNTRAAFILRRPKVMDYHWDKINTTRYLQLNINNDNFALHSFSFRLMYPDTDLDLTISEEVQTPIAAFALDDRVVYRYFSISHNSDSMAKYLIDFKILRSWVINQGIDYSRISLYYYDGGEWYEIIPELLSTKNFNYAYYHAISDVHEYYAIAINDGHEMIAPAIVPKIADLTNNTDTNTTLLNVTNTTQKKEESAILLAITSTSIIPNEEVPLEEGQLEKPIVEEIPSGEKSNNLFWALIAIALVASLGLAFLYMSRKKEEPVITEDEDEVEFEIFDQILSPPMQDFKESLYDGIKKTHEDAAAQTKENMECLNIELTAMKEDHNKKELDDETKQLLLTICNNSTKEQAIRLAAELGVGTEYVLQAYDERLQKQEFNKKLAAFESKVIDTYISSMRKNGHKDGEIREYLLKKGFNEADIASKGLNSIE